MSVREWIGLALTIVAVALVPLGWIISAKLLLVALGLIVAGSLLFMTQRRLKQLEECEPRSNAGPHVPADIHNYTGWRTGGRREDLESTLESGGSDVD